VKKAQSIDYRALKKSLSLYFHFTFRAPAKNKDFKPQQKSALIRAFNKIAEYINDDFKVKKDKYTFLKYPTKPRKSLLRGVDGVRVHTGLFYKHAKASIKKLKFPKGKYVVVVNPTVTHIVSKSGIEYPVEMQKRRDLFFPIPKKYLTDINKIKAYVDSLREKYGPHEIMWSYAGTRERVRYDPALFDLYFSDSGDESFEYKGKKFRETLEKNPNFYNGVFFIYYL
jgi:hypothetical protein